MSDGTVRGGFDLNADPALGKLRRITTEGGRADAMMSQLGTTMDRIGGPTATRRLDTYASKVRGVGDAAERTTAKVSAAWDAQRRSIEDQSRRIEARVDTLQSRVERYGRTRASAHVELGGVDRVNAQLMELERRLNRLSRQRANPSVGLTGGFSNMVGGGGGGASSPTGGGGGSFGMGAKLAIGGAALLPGAQALGVSATALAGSASGAALGLGTIYGGGAATLGTGALLSYSIAKPAIKGLQELQKEQTKYTKTVERYGAASKQAAVQREALNRAEAKDPGADVALRQVSLLRSTYTSLTRPGRRSFYEGIGNAAVAGRHAAPVIAGAANKDMGAVSRAMTNYAGFLAGSQSERTVMGLSQEFARDMPIVERSLQNVTSTIEHLSLAARPFFHEGVQWVQSWTHGLASSTASEARVQHTMRGLVSETKDWGRLTGATFRTVRDIFNMGRPSGDSMVVELTKTLDRWDAWIQRNPTKVQGFFHEAQTTTEKIGSALTGIAHLLSQMATSLGPIFNRAMSLISVMSRLGPMGTTAASALAYGAYSGFRGSASRTGVSPVGLVMSGVLGRPVGFSGGSRAGGGVVVGGTAAPASAAHYLMTSGGGPTGVAATMGTQQLPLFIPRGSGVTTARATPEAFTARYGNVEGARYAMPVSELGPATSRFAPIKGALGGAAKTLGATLAVVGALEAAGKGGNLGQVGQNFASSVSFGLVKGVNPKGGAGAEWASKFLQGIPGTAGAARQQALIAGKITRDLSRPFFDSKSVPWTLGIGHQPVSYAGAYTGKGGELDPNSPRFMQQVQGVLGRLEKEGGAGGHGKNVIEEVKALRTAYQEAAARARELKAEQNAVLDAKQKEEATRAGSQLSGAFGVERKGGRSVQGAFGDVTEGVLKRMKGMRAAGSKVLAENTLAWARQMERGNPQLKGVVSSLTKDIVARFRDLGQNVQVVNNRILSGSEAEWSHISRSMAEPIEQAKERMSAAFTSIQREAVGSLRAMGFSPTSAAQMVGNLERGGAAGSHASAAVSAAQSGNVKGQHQQEMAANLSPNKGHARGGMIGGSGLLDTQSVPGGKAAAGEAWIANRHTMNDLSRATIEKFGKTAWQMIQGEHRAHHMPPARSGILPDAGLRFALGGPVGNLSAMVSEANAITARHFPYSWGGGHNSNFTGPYDCSGAVSAVLHSGGALGSPEVASQFMSYGLPGPGAVTLFADPAHVYMRMGQKYFGTSTANPGGGAAWFNGSPRPGFVQRHIEVTGGAGALGAINMAGGGGMAQAIHLKGRKSGLHGVPGALADRGSLLYAAALQSHVNKKLASAGGTNLAGFHGGGGTSSANEALGKRMMLAAGYSASEWPALQALWTQESGWNANSVNSSSGAYGIPQALGHGHPFALGDAAAQIAWGLNYIRGRYGSPSAAEAHERSFNWYSRGGKTPTWAGWHAKGGEYETRGPVIFGAGERGKERVSITPVHSNSTGAKGHKIEVNIGHVTMASDADVEAVAREVAGKIMDELDRVGHGPTDRELIGR